MSCSRSVARADRPTDRRRCSRSLSGSALGAGEEMEMEMGMGTEMFAAIGMDGLVAWTSRVRTYLTVRSGEVDRACRLADVRILGHTSIFIGRGEVVCGGETGRDCGV